MKYQKPELNQLGAGERVVLGSRPMGNDAGVAGSHASSAFEFEE
jgi:hypothetical protein